MSSAADPFDVSWFEAYRDLTRQEAEDLARSEGRVVRVVRPGDVVTLEFSPSRLTVHVDADGTLRSLAPG
ncbi:I78 family peptidase inhibitor [Kineococcus sp. SYSU DK004]|uniref:I78 family peptidase inhibitor n=1 Tax=Kineococcus sp. SYSU DK004 TaxID=3383125 RepID=UPI003D7D3246